MEEILTPSQVAELLQIHVKTVYRLADEGLIPGNKIGRSWRFNKKNVLELVSNKRRKRTREEKSLGVKKHNSQS